MLNSTQRTPIRNVYCSDPADLVVPHSCPCCVRCWLYVAGRKTGMCANGGPFSGFKREHADPRPEDGPTT